MTERFLSAKEVAKILQIAESTAYAKVRGWNMELADMGYFTKAGYIPKAFFATKIYGYCEEKTERGG